MSEEKSAHELPKNVERYLAALSKIYTRESETQLLEIIVNSKIRVHEEWDYDNWNGGTWGHAIYFSVPEFLYLSVVNELEKIQNRIREDFNKIQNIQNEWISEVFLELGDADDSDWRKESGVLFSIQRDIAPATEDRIWGDSGFKLFLSHKSECKVEVAEMKKKFARFGVSAFVAHEDIHPTQEWQDEIENALFSMEGFVALMSEDFRDSNWTDQEVGVAIGRQVPIISVRLGTDPYGFIGKYQALTSDWAKAALEVTKLMINKPLMLESYLRTVENCKSWDHGNELAELLSSISSLSGHQADRLVNAYNSNSEVRGAFGFNGSKPAIYGPGLVAHLSRLTGSSYAYKGREIEKL
jgi:hypothetical protein